jgi:CheY-like chemotaxis protein
MEPVSVLVSSALFVGAEVFRKPSDELAGATWKAFTRAFQKALDKDPEPPLVTEASVATVIDAAPAVRARLESVAERASALRRARLVGRVVQGARILWIDDRPENNSWERGLLSSMGARFVTVESTRSAVAVLRQERLDLVLSDIARGGNQREGIEAIRRIRSVQPHIPIVFYTGYEIGGQAPEGTQGITADLNELLHLVFDQLERHRA